MVLLLLCYLLGAVPWAYLISRLVSGIDIRAVGDGNVGARNVYHQVGKKAGVAVGVLDFVKGTAAVWLARQFGLSEIGVYAAGGAAVLGHDWSPFLRFRGGQGHATTVGVFLSLMPLETAISMAVVALVLLLSRHWELANGIGFACLPLAAWWGDRPFSLILYVGALFPLVGVKKLIDMRRKNRLKLPGSPPLSPGENRHSQM